MLLFNSANCDLGSNSPHLNATDHYGEAGGRAAGADVADGIHVSTRKRELDPAFASDETAATGGYLKFVGRYFGLVDEDSPFALSGPCVLWLHIVLMLCCVHNVLLFDSYHHEFEYIQKPENRKTIEDYIPALKELRDSLPEIAESDKEFHSKNVVIAVNGYWYDVEAFIPKHPGGPIIKQYIGADVTSSFYGMHRHPDEILARRTPVAKLKKDADALRNAEINADYWNLWHRYKEQGYFDPSLPWLARTAGSVLVIAAVAAYSCWHFPESWFFNGMLAGNVFCQGGFLLHDAMHRLVHPDPKVCYIVGWFAGNVCFGVNSAWWRIEHDPHHAAPNSWDRINGKIFDEQAREDVFCQDDVLFGFYQLFFHPFFIANQWWSAVLLPLLLSKPGIMLDSYVNHGEKNPKMLLGGALHFLWVYLLFRQLDHPLWALFVASCTQGTLAMQLVGNHYWKPWCEIEDQKYVSFPAR